MSEGAFIDGLQTRAQRERRGQSEVRPRSVRVARQAQSRSGQGERVARVNALQSWGSGDPLSAQATRREAGRVQRPQSTRKVTPQAKARGVVSVVSSAMPVVGARAATERKSVVKKTGNWLEDAWQEKKAQEVEELGGRLGGAASGEHRASNGAWSNGKRAAVRNMQKRASSERVEAARDSEDDYRREVLGLVDDNEEDEELNFFDEDLFAEERQLKKEQAKKAKAGKKHWWKRVFLAVVLVLVVAGAGVFIWGDSLVSKMTGGNVGLIDLIRTALLSDGEAKFKTAPDGRTNVLLFGTSGYDMAGSYGETTHDGAQLTDTIMVLSIAQETGDMAMISVQRDLLVGTCLATGKINEVYYCANQDGKNEAAGAAALQDTVSRVVGLDTQYYVHVDWMALIALVDALDGITVTLDERIADGGTNTFIEPGVPTQLNGSQALGLARARYGTDDGDFSRANSQQKILMGIKERVMERGLGFTELLNVANVLGDNVRMNFSAEEIAAAAKLVTTADIGSMRQINLRDGGALSTGTLGGVSYVLPTSGEYNYDGIKDYVNGQLSSIKVEEAGRILVLNGSGVDGIAAAERGLLTDAGFTVAGIGDAPAGEYFDKYYLYPVTNKPQTLERLEQYYNVKAVDADLLPQGINTEGVDFVVILGIGYSG